MSTLAFTSSPGAAGLFARSWWALLMRGILAVILGFLAFTWPVITLTAVVTAFGIYAFVEGFASLFAAIVGWSHQENRWLLVLQAIIGIGIGIVTFRTPGITATVLMFFIAVWALATGVLRIAEGVQLRREISGEVWLIVGGVASIVFALVVLLRPMLGALALIQVLGLYALFLGVTELLLAFEMRGIHRREVLQPILHH